MRDQAAGSTQAKRPPMRIALILAAVTVAACDNNPTKNSTKATVNEPVATASQAATSANAVVYTFSNEGSKVAFVGAKVTGKHEGGFGKFTGTVKIIDNDVANSTVSVDIEPTSLFADQEKLTTHLKSADFFDVEKFSKASFVSTQIKAGGDKGATHTVIGNLTLHGVTKSISFPASIKKVETGVEADADFGINRKDFGIAYAGKADDLIKDDVLIKLTVRTKK